MRTLPPACQFAVLTLVACGCSSPKTTPTAPKPSDAPEMDLGTDPTPGSFPIEVTEPTRLTEEQLAAYGYPYEMVEGEPLFRVLEHDGIPSIDEPKFVGVDEAMEWMEFDESVLGVVGVDGTAKCYSAWQLDSHEIVNDEIDGHAIAATW